MASSPQFGSWLWGFLHPQMMHRKQDLSGTVPGIAGATHVVSPAASNAVAHGLTVATGQAGVHFSQTHAIDHSVT